MQFSQIVNSTNVVLKPASSLDFAGSLPVVAFECNSFVDALVTLL